MSLEFTHPLLELAVQEDNRKLTQSEAKIVFQARLNHAKETLYERLSQESQSIIQSVSMNYCRRQNGGLTFAFTLFPYRYGNYRQLFFNATNVEPENMAKFIEENYQILTIN